MPYLFYNLTDQTSGNFKTAVSILDGIVWFDVPNDTDLWQAVDGGFEDLPKTLALQQHSSLLRSDKNVDKLHNGKISAKERLILIIQWVKTVYKKISSPEDQSFWWRMFEKTGCLIAADGSDNDKIKPEDFPEYHVQPPYNYIKATSALP